MKVKDIEMLFDKYKDYSIGGLVDARDENEDPIVNGVLTQMIEEEIASSMSDRDLLIKIYIKLMGYGIL